MTRTQRSDSPMTLSEGSNESLAQLATAQTLEQIYAAWHGVQQAFRRDRAVLDQEEARLVREGQFVLGAVRAAGTPVRGAAEEASSALTNVEGFGNDVEARLAEARSALRQRKAAFVEKEREALRNAEAQVKAWVSRYATHARPVLQATLRSVFGGRCVLHLKHPGDDAAAVLLWLSTGKIASRYGFLSDDSVNVVGSDPPTLYPDGGLDSEQTSPAASAWPALWGTFGEVLPIKGFLPFWIDETTLYRLVLRGAVLEAECLENGAFRSVLQQSEAERLAGFWLRWKFAGRVDVELTTE